MPRATYIPNSVMPFHVNARCINREWFSLPLDQVWEIFSDYLFFISKAYEVEIFAFVLMSNHFHLLLKTPLANLAEVMNYFMRETSRNITYLAGRINQTYGAPYRGTLIKNEHHFKTAYKYVYRNPVEANLCYKVEEYPYSTLNGLIGQRKLIIPMAEDFLLFNDFEGTLNWLNKEVTQEHYNAVRLALKKNIFKFPSDPHSRKIHALESEDY